jgi:TonB family protein
VLVRYDVTAEGTITNVALVKSSGFARLDAAAVTCVTRRWRNTPATSGGVPVPSANHEAIIRFALREAPPPPVAVAAADSGVLRIVLIVLGMFAVGAVALALFLATRRRRTP